jgi:hypothetical protein
LKDQLQYPVLGKEDKSNGVGGGIGRRSSLDVGKLALALDTNSPFRHCVDVVIVVVVGNAGNSFGNNMELVQHPVTRHIQC